MAGPMSSESVRNCPFCGDNYTHINTIRLGVREEDRPITYITINAVTGALAIRPSTDLSGASSRRQWLELDWSCEQCAGGTELLSQHKGETYRELRPGGVAHPINERGYPEWQVPDDERQGRT
jgi:hypothetical protein